MQIMLDNTNQHWVSSKLNQIPLEIIYGWPRWLIFQFSSQYSLLMIPAAAWWRCNELLPRSQIRVALLLFLNFHFFTSFCWEQLWEEGGWCCKDLVNIFSNFWASRVINPPLLAWHSTPHPSYLHLHPRPDTKYPLVTIWPNRVSLRRVTPPTGAQHPSSLTSPSSPHLAAPCPMSRRAALCDSPTFLIAVTHHPDTRAVTQWSLWHP